MVLSDLPNGGALAKCFLSKKVIAMQSISVFVG